MSPQIKLLPPLAREATNSLWLLLNETSSPRILVSSSTDGVGSCVRGEMRVGWVASANQWTLSGHCVHCTNSKCWIVIDRLVYMYAVKVQEKGFQNGSLIFLESLASVHKKMWCLCLWLLLRCGAHCGLFGCDPENFRILYFWGSNLKHFVSVFVFIKVALLCLQLTIWRLWQASRRRYAAYGYC